jgi:hypothetical protein
VDFDEALAAYRRVRAPSEGAVGALIDGNVAASAAPGAERAGILTVATREIAHTFAHAGELVAIGSLAGQSDIGLPGALAHSAASFARA